MAKEGQKVAVSYVGKFDDGEVFDSTESHGGDLLEFVVGSGQVIPGFDAAVRDLEVGESKSVSIEPADAYGEYNDALLQTIPMAEAGELGQQLKDAVGNYVYLQDNMGNIQEVKVVSVDDDALTLDFNPRMAGKRLNFDIKLERVDEA